MAAAETRGGVYMSYGHDGIVKDVFPGSESNTPKESRDIRYSRAV